MTTQKKTDTSKFREGTFKYEGVALKYQQPIAMPENSTEDVTGVDVWPAATKSALEALRPVYQLIFNLNFIFYRIF